MRRFYIFLFAMYALWISIEWMGFSCIFMTYAMVTPEIGAEYGILTLIILGTLVLPTLGALDYPKSLDEAWRIDHTVDVDKEPSEKG